MDSARCEGTERGYGDKDGGKHTSDEEEVQDPHDALREVVRGTSVLTTRTVLNCSDPATAALWITRNALGSEKSGALSASDALRVARRR
jgi:hypothetical protein